MNLRLLPASLLLLTTNVLAQEVPPGEKAQGDKPAVQEPKTEPQEPSPSEVITQLRREKERLLQEIEYAKNRSKNANRMLAEKLGRRGQTFASIDAGTNQPARPEPVQMRKARVLTEAEKVNYGDDVMLVVDGLEIRQAEFDRLMDYMRSLSNTGDDKMRAQRILFELIRVYSVASAFAETTAEAQVTELYGQLQNGKPLEELARNFGTVLGAKEDGSVVVTRNSFLGTTLESIAFGLKEGEFSRPFRNVFGYVIIGADKIEKGTTPELDKVTVRALQVRYPGDQAKLNEAQAAASRGQVEVLARDQEVLEMLPAMYRPTADVPAPRQNPRANLTNQLRTIDARIKLIESGGVESADPKAELEALKKQRDAVNKALEQISGKTPGESDAGAIPGKGLKKKDGGAPLTPVKKL